MSGLPLKHRNMAFLPNQSQFNSILKFTNDGNRENRESAYNKLVETGFPTKNDEKWRYTNLSKLLKTDYLLTPNKLQNIDLSIISEYYIENTIQIILFNGAINSELSDIDKLPKQIVINNNSEDSDKSIYDNQFVLMNRAFYNSGYNIEIQSNYTSENPLHILNIIDTNNEFIQSHHLNIISVGKNSEIVIIEETVILTETDSFQNTVTKIKINDNASLSHTLIQKNSSQTKSINHTFVEQKASSTFNNQIVNIGGDLTRNDIDVQLNGENCTTDISGLSLLSGNNHIENYTTVIHNSPNSNSNQLFKYILRGKSEGVFNGLVKVQPNAQYTDSQQSNKNILLSKNALMNANPQLEIYADDVKCSHGSATGELDDDAIFYLRSRGIDLVSAQSLLIEGFAKEVIETIESDYIKQKLNTEIIKWLAK